MTELTPEVRETLTLLPDGRLQAGTITYMLEPHHRDLITVLASRPGVFFTAKGVVRYMETYLGRKYSSNTVPVNTVERYWDGISRFAEERFERTVEETGKHKRYYRMFGDIALDDQFGMPPIPPLPTQET